MFNIFLFFFLELYLSALIKLLFWTIYAYYFPALTIISLQWTTFSWKLKLVSNLTFSFWKTKVPKLLTFDAYIKHWTCVPLGFELSYPLCIMQFSFQLTSPFQQWVGGRLDCYTVSRGLSLGCETRSPISRHHPLCLTGLNIGWDCPSCNGLWAHMTSGNFHCFSEDADSPLAQP